MVSSSHQHRQHQLTKGKFFLTRLSIMRIPPLAAVHKKKYTLLGTLTLQMHCQGKKKPTENSIMIYEKKAHQRHHYDSIAKPWYHHPP